MGPEKGTTPIDDRWRSHRVAALLLRVAIFLIPLGAGFLAGRAVSQLLPETETAADIAIWWVAVITSATIAATLVDRLARRLLPLTILLKMTMLFPDRAPSRMRVALRSGNFTELRKRIDDVQHGGDPDLGEMSELILSLAAALSQHDRKTRGHSERTRAYTDIIAEEMGLPEEARDKLRWAALLHDVGKLEVPAEILNKDSKLSDEEWHLVRQHPVLGMKLVAPLIPWLGEWAKTIEHHHERFDGTGYPHGLAGTQIALGARIVSVGDAYDVMTSGRAYQKARTPAAARQEIAAMAGSQFDPLVVRALMNVSLGRLQIAAGPLAMIAELPFIRGLPQVGRDAATLLTSSAFMATSMAAGIIPPPADFLPPALAEAVDMAMEPIEDPPATIQTQPPEAPDSTTTTMPDETTTTTAPTGTTTTTAPDTTTTTPLPGTPVLGEDAASTAEGSPVVIDVLANDRSTDGELDLATLRVASPASNGTVTVSGSRITYLPDSGFVGVDSFRYEVCNDARVCASGTVTVTVTPVNHAPALLTTTVTMDEDTTLNLPLEVTDPDGDEVICRVSANPEVGAATVPADCSKLVYQPPADHNGTVTVTIALDDGELEAAGTVTITIRPVNDAPVASNDVATTGWSETVDVPVLGNDTDPDGDTLTPVIVSQPASGSVAVVGSAIRYTPVFGAGGTFSFQYQACDPAGACDAATVTVTVAAITIAQDDSTGTQQGVTIVFTASANDAAGNGSWARDTFKVVTQPANGVARTLGGGRIRYTPNAEFTGTDSFVYQACDTAGSCDTATVTVTVS